MCVRACVRAYLQQLENVVFVSVDESLGGDPQRSHCLVHGGGKEENQGSNQDKMEKLWRGDRNTGTAALTQAQVTQCCFMVKGHWL